MKDVQHCIELDLIPGSMKSNPLNIEHLVKIDIQIQGLHSMLPNAAFIFSDKSHEFLC